MRNFLTCAPGIVWAAIIVLLVLLADWLSTYFGGLPWVPPVAGFLVAVLVPVLRLLAQGAEPAGRGADGAPRTTLNRLLW